MSHDTNKPSPSGKMLDVETWDALKASGYTEDELLAEQPFGPIIFSYTRAQAIEDGVLVDLTGQDESAKLVREAGFKLPVAMTATAFSEAVGPIGSELPAGQSWRGRLWDVLMLLRHAVALNRNTDRVNFQVSVDVDGTGQNRKTVKLWALVGPGDTADPLLTIMLEGED
jgi:hypothetical protein